MSEVPVTALDENARAGEKVQRCIDAFIEGAPRRSAIVKLHRPVKATWMANPDIEHPAASLLKIPLVGALLIAASESARSGWWRLTPPD